MGCRPTAAAINERQRLSVSRYCGCGDRRRKRSPPAALRCSRMALAGRAGLAPASFVLPLHLAESAASSEPTPKHQVKLPISRTFRVGRAGLEPATLGLRVRPNKLRQAAAD